jgi:hypothetical protein
MRKGPFVPENSDCSPYSRTGLRVKPCGTSPASRRVVSATGLSKSKPNTHAAGIWCARPPRLCSPHCRSNDRCNGERPCPARIRMCWLRRAYLDFECQFRAGMGRGDLSERRLRLFLWLGGKANLWTFCAGLIASSFVIPRRSCLYCCSDPRRIPAP